MKRIILIGILFFLSLGLQAQFIKAELEVSGLTCSMCSLSTQKSLKTLDFIGDIKPDLNKNIFYIEFVPGREVNLSAMKDKVKAAGFSVSKLIAVFNFNQIKISRDFIFNYHGSNYYFVDAPDKILNGETRFMILDKDFVSSKDFKKMSFGIKDPLPLSPLPEKNLHVFHIRLTK